jgi:hypothetical protein
VKPSPDEVMDKFIAFLLAGYKLIRLQAARNFVHLGDVCFIT